MKYSIKRFKASRNYYYYKPISKMQYLIGAQNFHKALATGRN